MGGSRTIGTRARVLSRMLLVVAVAAAAVAVGASPGSAITNGQPDEGRHPYVGGTVLYYAPLDETIVNCTGSLIARTIFLTAAHCGTHGDRVSVIFDEVFHPATSRRHAGTFVAHPDYNPAQWSRYDVAVIVLDRAVPGVDTSKLPLLPQSGLLDRMRADGTLNTGTRLTSVGYGLLGYGNGPGGQTPIDGQSRLYSVGSYNSLDPDQLHLSQNPQHGDGGTCNGDSGGPNFLGAGATETRVIAGLTAAGDTYCKATNVTYRLDTAAARSFLGRYVPLP